MLKYILFIFSFLVFEQLYAVDYSSNENWAALPSINSNALWSPEGNTPNQDSMQVDVFYIHPTTYLVSGTPNAFLGMKVVNKITDNHPLKYQASAFNYAAKIYAPRYRQAALFNFTMLDRNIAQKAFDKAYEDIKEAFEYYLKNYNHNRPIIISGHSQGAMHAKRLLADYFDGKPLQQQLVAAYIIGYPVYNDELKHIPSCSFAEQNNCIISYSTFSEDANSKRVKYFNYESIAINTNPITWNNMPYDKNNSTYLGSFDTKQDKKMFYIEKCYPKDGVIYINTIDGIQGKDEGNYHLFDFSLFYYNIRQNVIDRVKVFLQNSKTAKK
jgi:hypothetical protein